MNIPSQSGTMNQDVVLWLFVAGDEPHSESARANIRKLCDLHLNSCCRIETIDVLEDFDLALKHNIFLTPALIKISPKPQTTIYGDLSDIQKVLISLRLTGH